MLRILNQGKGFKVDFKQRKEFTPLQKKCIDVVSETQKLLEEAAKHEEVKTFESELYHIVALHAMIPTAMKSKNENFIKLQLRTLYDFVIKIDFQIVPKEFKKPFLVYRKKVIERIGGI